MDFFLMSEEDSKAHKNAVLGMTDEKSGDRYARATGQEGVGRTREMATQRHEC